MPVMDRFDSMKMLASSTSQYLPPDYLQPLPTTLDAKNSPLALLAQTCSSIGKDPPTKPTIPPIEKKESMDKPSHADMNNKNRSPPHRMKEVHSPSEQSRPTHEQSRPTQADNSDISKFYPLTTSSPKLEHSSSVIQKMREDKKRHEIDRKPTPTSRPSSSSSASGLRSSRESVSPCAKASEHVKDNKEVRYSPPLKRQRSASPIRREYSPETDGKYPTSIYPGLPLGHLGFAGLPYGAGGYSASPEALAAAGYPFSLPGQMSAYSLSAAHASAVAAHQAAALKSGSSAALSQYMQYARMRNPSSLPSVPGTVCKDPFCANCVAHLPSQCSTPGCAQCVHDKTLQGLNPHGLSGSHNQFHSSLASSAGLNSASAGLSTLHSLYAQNMLSQQQHGHPHVCNWMAGNEYCGKRFTTSEELLQHLRTHTSGGEAALNAYGSLGLTIPQASVDAASLHGYMSSVGNLSPETLRRMYPTSLSPLSGSSLGSRYHPYKSGLPTVPAGLPSQQTLASLGPYYSPYGLYGQRIGSASVP